MKKTKHNYKLSEQDKQEIVISHYLDHSKENIQAICDKFGISDTTIYNLVNASKGNEIIEQRINEVKHNLSKKIDLMLDKIVNQLMQQIENEDIKAMDKAKIFGILYDKSRLENNLSTSNNSININIKVEK
jgi:transposase-like protein